MKKFLFILLFPSWCFASSITMQLTNIRVADLGRIIYSDVSPKSYLFESDFLNSDDVVSINWIKLSSADVNSLFDDVLIAHGFDSVQRGKLLVVRKKTKGDEQLLIYRPRFRSAKYLSDMVLKVAGAQDMGVRGVESSAISAAALNKGTEVVGSASSQVNRSALDQLAYSCFEAECDRLKKMLSDIDTPEAQIVLHAAIYEVGSNSTEGGALHIAGKLLGGALSSAVGVSPLAGAAGQLNIAGANFSAVMTALDNDSHFKVLSRPMLRVRTGSQATFSVGQDVPVLGSVSQDKNGNAVQSVDYRKSGTIFTVQPDVRGDSVDLVVTQELSSFVVTTTGVNNSPTLLKRIATSTLGIKPGEVIVFAGLAEQRDDEMQSHLFGWLLGKQKSATTSEVLVFIQAEAI